MPPRRIGLISNHGKPGASELVPPGADTVTVEAAVPKFGVTAVMEADPTARVEVVKVATPLPFSVPVPSVELPFLKVTDRPCFEGFREEVTAVVVLS